MSAEAHPVHRWRQAITESPVDELPATARLVGFALSMNVNPAGEVWVGADTVARATALSEKSARTHMRTLEKHGLLVCLSPGGTAGGTRTTRWRITTPEPHSEVTPEPGSEVSAPTPEPRSRTPEPRSRTPERGSDELGERGELGGERARAHELVQRHPEEIDQVLAQFDHEFGRTAVDLVLAELLEDGTTYAWARNLGDAMERRLPDVRQNVERRRQRERAKDPVAALSPAAKEALAELERSA